MVAPRDQAVCGAKQRAALMTTSINSNRLPSTDMAGAGPAMSNRWLCGTPELGFSLIGY